MDSLAPIGDALGTRFHATRPLSGGAVGEVLWVQSDAGELVVKRQPGGAPSGFFAAEAAGLEWLRRAKAFRIPEVLGVAEDWLVLEYLPPAATPEGTDGAVLLAQQHRVTPATFGLPAHFGLDTDNFLGPYPQRNAWEARWPTFYERRLLGQFVLAAHAGLVPPKRALTFERVLSRLPELLSGLDEPPCLIHGDLWSGNFLHTIHGPALIDPAVYFGSRELELAYIELFGGFPEGFVAAYHQAYPLDSGYPRRRPVHQLYPLLVHLNYFGERYGPMLDSALESLQ